jgi:hypothetical protein
MATARRQSLPFSLEPAFGAVPSMRRGQDRPE